MTGVTLPVALPEWARGWNVVDVTLAVWLTLYALDGMRRGFIAGVVGLVCILAALLTEAHTYTIAAGLIRQYAPLPDLIANVAGFFVVLVIAQLVFSIIGRLILAALAPVRLILAPLMIFDHLLGAIPGLIQGVAIAALVLVPLELVAKSGPIGDAIAGSTLAPLVARGTSLVMPQLERVAQQTFGDVPLFRSRIVGSEENVRLVPRQQFSVDPQAESDMLVLVNKERTSRGLRPLVADPGMREVARQHSAEMFQMGYFAHVSPVTGSPVDRLGRAGLFYSVTGENLAYAPTVQAAHDGLMASPGHRANILEPHYARAGIGVQNAGLYGRMFTQEFAGE